MEAARDGPGRIGGAGCLENKDQRVVAVLIREMLYSWSAPLT